MAFFQRRKTEQETSKARHHHGPALHLPLEPRILGINWLGIRTMDIVGEAIFMEEVLHLPFADEGNSRLGHHIRYNCGTMEVELLEGAVAWANQPKPRRGAPDVSLVPSFLVDDLNPASTLIYEKEVPATQVFDQGWVRSLLFFDPERNLWQVAQILTRPPVDTNDFRYLGVLWLSVEDMDEQVRFYQEVLGLPLADRGGTERPITEQAEQEQARLREENPGENVETVLDENEDSPRLDMGAVFFEKGARLALSPGGLKLEDGAPRVWGRDTAYQIGFRAQNVVGLARKLHELKVPVSGPFQDQRGRHTLQFTDPEGNTHRVSES